MTGENPASHEVTGILQTCVKPDSDTGIGEIHQTASENAFGYAADVVSLRILYRIRVSVGTFY